ncbi:helix-turn-helix transcriptional regulator [Sporosalibacterium faouarense]|uniref:helix-turn-helix domain-containing protein n=1 Tax=Sporosalibacterium faouarense TaxID=516123 RepID=UPI00311C9F4A
MDKFGDRLRKLRKEKKLTQVELGKLLKTSHATINRYENNIHQPDLDTLNKLANIFNVSTDYLLGRVDNKEIAIIEGKEIPTELSKIGVEYLEVNKELKEKGFTPKKIKRLIETLEDLNKK